jgi:hypothetical protein
MLHKIDWISRILIGGLLAATIGITGWVGDRAATKLDDNTAAIVDLGERVTRVETLLNGK